MATEKPIAAEPAPVPAPPSVAPFLTKLFDMVDDPSTDATVSWSRAGNSFVIWDHHTFGKDLLPKYFRHSNFSSFVRQLNTYGFHKVDPDRYEFASEGFLRGQKHLLKAIRRRKPPHNTQQQQLPQGKPPSVEACIEVGKFGLKEDIAMLQRDKNLLMQELVKLRQHHQNSNLQIHNVTQRIREMERNQQQMLSFLAMVVQSPGFLAQLVQQNGNIRWKPEANKKRRFPAIEQGAMDVKSPDGQIVEYQPVLAEMSSPDLGTVLDADVGNVRPMPGGDNDLCENGNAMSDGGDNDLCVNGNAMSDGEDPWSSPDGDFSMPDFSDFDLDQLLASPLPETNAEIEAAIPDFMKDLEFPGLETKMDFSENGSFK